MVFIVAEHHFTSSYIWGTIGAMIILFLAFFFSFLFFSSYLLNLKTIRPPNTLLTSNGLPLERSELVVLRTLLNLIFNFDGGKTVL